MALFGKKNGRSQNEVDDLDAGYNEDYYVGDRMGDRSDRRDGGRDRYEESRDGRYDRDSRYAREDDRERDMRGDRYGRDDRLERRDPSDRYDRSDDYDRGDRLDRDRYGRDDGYGRDEYDRRPARSGWQEADAPSYRDREREREDVRSEPVFEPAPAPEYRYFVPESYNECHEGIADGLSAGHVVVVRVSHMEKDEVRFLFAFMQGAVMVVKGSLVCPTSGIVVLLPKDVELDEDELESIDEEAYAEDEDAEGDEEYEAEEEEDDYHNGEYGGYDEEDSDRDAE